MEKSKILKTQPPLPPPAPNFNKQGDSNYEYFGAISLQIKLIDCFINFLP